MAARRPRSGQDDTTAQRRSGNNDATDASAAAPDAVSGDAFGSDRPPLPGHDGHVSSGDAFGEPAREGGALRRRALLLRAFAAAASLAALVPVARAFPRIALALLALVLFANAALQARTCAARIAASLSFAPPSISLVALPRRRVSRVRCFPAALRCAAQLNNISGCSTPLRRMRFR
jgi:hypothetical protein